MIVKLLFIKDALYIKLGFLILTNTKYSYKTIVRAMAHLNLYICLDVLFSKIDNTLVQH